MIGIGEYIKTDADIIARIAGIMKDGSYELDIEFENEYIVYDYNIISHSKNILDLIECQDLLYIDISPDDFGGIIVPRIAETLNELNLLKTKIENGYYILKGIIPKEKLNREVYNI